MDCCCPVCGDEIRKTIIGNAEALGARYDVLYCDRCQVGRTAPVVPPEVLARLYSTGSYRTGSGKRFHEPLETLVYLCRQLRKRRIEKHVRRGKILDIGCGRGLFLGVMRAHGWSVVGVEIDQETAENASVAHGIDVVAAGRMGSELPDGDFDVVTLYHVLEHVSDPVGTVRECARVLKKGGLLVVAVPNILSLQASFGKQVWFHLDPPYHLHHFSEPGLAKLLERHSFALRAVRRFDWEYDVFSWLQTLLNRMGIRKNLFYDALKTGRLRNRQSQDLMGWGLLVTFLFLPFLVPLSLVLSLSESYLLKKGGTIEVYAIKS